MSKIRFNLKHPNATNDTLIYLFFSFQSTRLKYSTGQTIKPKFWNSKKQRAKESRQFPQYPELNTYLNNLESETLNIYRRLINEGGIPTTDKLREELDVFTSRSNREKVISPTLFVFIEQFIEERSNLPNFVKGSIAVYRTCYKHLKAFAEKKRRKLDFGDIDLDFFFDFQKYLFSKPNQFSQNHANKIISTLKTFLNEATERGINKNRAYKSRRFNISKSPVQNIYLSLDELNTLFHLNLNNNERLDRVRDLFLIGAFTGLRFSDFTNIKPGSIRIIDGTQVIKLTSQKTGGSVTIPVHPIIKTILDKYNGETPRPLSNQRMNKYLKELAKLAGFNEKIMLAKNKAGKRYDKSFEKWELVTTHTARRSFATNAFKMGLPTVAIMKITGHKTETQFMKYIKISNDENAVLMAKNRFFKSAPLKSVK